MEGQHKEGPDKGQGKWQSAGQYAKSGYIDCVKERSTKYADKHILSYSGHRYKNGEKGFFIGASSGGILLLRYVKIILKKFPHTFLEKLLFQGRLIKM